MSELTWLTVGGCPRSGTTALGAALSESRSICLFHEVRAHHFFNCVKGLFAEEERHRAYPEFVRYKQSMPVAARDSVPIVTSIFEAVFHEQPSIVGTKLPNFFLEPPPIFPPGIAEKVIMISRNPYDVVLSYALKRHDDGEISERLGAGSEVALAEWIYAWNYAVARHGADDFYHVLYEDLDGIANGRIAREIADFLGVENDFDLGGISPKGQLDIRNRYLTERNQFAVKNTFLEMGLHEFSNTAERFAAAGMEGTDETIGQLFSYEQWQEQAHHCLKHRTLTVFPLKASEAIDFTTGGNSWKYIREGFYPPELEGSWTRDGRSVLTFKPIEPIVGNMLCQLEIVWAVEHENVGPVATIRIDDQAAARLDLSLGERNGRGQTFSAVLQNFKAGPEPVVLEICVENPRVPKALGLNDDDRSLGVMIRRLTLR